MLTIKGKVKRGQQVGRRLGFPTINIPFPKSITKDQWGIYFSLVKIGNKLHPGATHLGPIASFTPARKTCETFLLDYNKDLYGVAVEKRLVFKFRDIENFSSAEKLKAQIKKDIKAAKKYFGL